MQYLHPGSTLIFENERDDETITHHSDEGLLKLIATDDIKSDLAGKVEFFIRTFSAQVMGTKSICDQT